MAKIPVPLVVSGFGSQTLEDSQATFVPSDLLLLAAPFRALRRLTDIDTTSIPYT